MFMPGESVMPLERIERSTLTVRRLFVMATMLLLPRTLPSPQW